MKKYLIWAAVGLGAFIVLRQLELRTPLGKLTGSKP